MISRVDASSDPLAQDRMLLVGVHPGGGEWVDQLRLRYGDWTLATCDTFLSSIVDVSQRGARAVLVHVDPSMPQLDHAVAGLREAAGPQTLLVLCCAPECEPTARRVLAFGADDYVLYPIDAGELDTAIGRPDTYVEDESRWTTPTTAPMEELARLSALLVGLDDKPGCLIARIASLIHTALHARGVSVVVEGAVGTSGEAVRKPILTAPLTDRKGVMGRIILHERESGAYTPGDMEKLTHYAAIISHILESAADQRRWRKLAYTDECSGLANRRYFNERLDGIIARAETEHFHITVLLFDLDDFKTYNDTSGHDAGDEIIRVVGDLLRQHCREQDIVARYGGDEFAVVFWDPDGPRVAGSRDPTSALSVLERFREALRAHRLSLLGSAQVGQLTISGGIASYPWDGATRNELLTCADQALLAAKRAGKNRIFLIGNGHQDNDCEESPSPSR